MGGKKLLCRLATKSNVGRHPARRVYLGPLGGFPLEAARVVPAGLPVGGPRQRIAAAAGVAARDVASALPGAAALRALKGQREAPQTQKKSGKAEH